MNIVLSGWKKYNANSNNNNVGDCVKRALSYAYGVDYDEISRRLNRLKRDIGSNAYNNRRVFSLFLKQNGATPIPNTNYKDMTEGQFADANPSGTYVLLTGPANKDYSTHLVCVMGGDVIDSWNSLDYKIHEAWKISSTELESYSVSWDDIQDELEDFIDKYIEDANKKCEGWYNIWSGDSYRVNDTTLRMKFYIRTSPNTPDESNYYANQTYMKSIVAKLNPLMDAEKNLASLKPKLKSKVYEWLYPYMKDMRDTKAIQNIETNPRYAKDTYSKKDLLKLPEWCRKYVTYFWVPQYPGSSGYYNNYEVKLEALPGDPRGEEYPKLTLGAETLTELKEMLEMYKENFARPGYDY